MSTGPASPDWRRKTEVPDGVQGLEVVEVHLPVPADQRTAGWRLRHRSKRLRVECLPARRCVRRTPQRRQSGKIPVFEQLEGRSSPGRYVVDPILEAQAAHGRNTVTTTDDGEAVALGHSAGDAGGAVGEPLVLEDAHRAVPQHRSGSGDDFGERRHRGRSHVQPLPARGDVHPDHPHPTGGAPVTELGPGFEGHDIGGEQDPLARSEKRRALGDSLLIDQGGADVMARSGQKGVAHPAPDHQGVHSLEECLEDTDLVRHLGPSHHGHEGTGWCGQKAAEHLDLPLEEKSGGTGKPGGWSDDRCVLAVGHAEGVVDVGVVPVDQLLHETRIIGLLARVEAQVLEQLDRRSQGSQLLAHRPEVPLGVGGGGRASQMGAGGDLGPLRQ